MECTRETGLAPDRRFVHRRPGARANRGDGRTPGRSYRRRSPAAPLVGQFSNTVPVPRIQPGLQSVAGDARIAEHEAGCAAPLGDAAPKSVDDQHSQRRPVSRCDLARLVEQSVGNLYGGLHMGIYIMGAIEPSIALIVAYSR